MSFIDVVISLLAIALTIVFFRRFIMARDPRYPPGPKGLPLVGNIYDMKPGVLPQRLYAEWGNEFGSSYSYQQYPARGWSFHLWQLQTSFMSGCRLVYISSSSIPLKLQWSCSIDVPLCTLIGMIWSYFDFIIPSYLALFQANSNDDAWPVGAKFRNPCSTVWKCFHLAWNSTGHLPWCPTETLGEHAGAFFVSALHYLTLSHSYCDRQISSYEGYRCRCIWKDTTQVCPHSSERFGAKPWEVDGACTPVRLTLFYQRFMTHWIM